MKIREGINIYLRLVGRLKGERTNAFSETGIKIFGGSCIKNCRKWVWSQ
jgi:hypothetical protein